MTRKEFISGYLDRSGNSECRIRGERIYWPHGSIWFALPCRCGDESCDGWAMIPESGRWWHLFQNTDTTMTGQEAMRRDMKSCKKNAT